MTEKDKYDGIQANATSEDVIHMVDLIYGLKVGEFILEQLVLLQFIENYLSSTFSLLVFNVDPYLLT